MPQIERFLPNTIVQFPKLNGGLSLLFAQARMEKPRPGSGRNIVVAVRHSPQSRVSDFGFADELLLPKNHSFLCTMESIDGRLTDVPMGINRPAPLLQHVLFGTQSLLQFKHPVVGEDTLDTARVIPPGGSSQPLLANRYTLKDTFFKMSKGKEFTTTSLALMCLGGNANGFSVVAYNKPNVAWREPVRVRNLDAITAEEMREIVGEDYFSTLRFANGLYPIKATPDQAAPLEEGPVDEEYAIDEGN